MMFRYFISSIAVAFWALSRPTAAQSSHDGEETGNLTLWKAAAAKGVKSCDNSLPVHGDMVEVKWNDGVVYSGKKKPLSFGR